MSIFYDKIQNNLDSQFLFFNKESPSWGIKNNIILTTSFFDINCDLNLTKIIYASNLENVQVTNQIKTNNILIKEGGKLKFQKSISTPFKINKIQIYDSCLGYNKATKKCQLKAKNNEPYYMNKVLVPKIQFTGIEYESKKTGITNGNHVDLFNLTFHHFNHYDFEWIKKFGLVSLPQNFEYLIQNSNVAHTWGEKGLKDSSWYFVSIPFDKRQRLFYEIEPTNINKKPFSSLNKELCFLKKGCFPRGEIDWTNGNKYPNEVNLTKYTEITIEGSKKPFLETWYTEYKISFDNGTSMTVSDGLNYNEWIYIGLQAKGGNASVNSMYTGGAGAYAVFCLHFPFDETDTIKPIRFNYDAQKKKWTIGNFSVEDGNGQTGGQIYHNTEEISQRTLIQDGNIVFVYGCPGGDGRTGAYLEEKTYNFKYDSREVGKRLKFLNNSYQFFAGPDIAPKYWFWQLRNFDRTATGNIKLGAPSYLMQISNGGSSVDKETGPGNFGAGQNINDSSSPGSPAFIYGF